jgi:hypothetical protein
VAHPCNPSFSGGRGQEDCGSRAAWVKGNRDPISTNNPASFIYLLGLKRSCTFHMEGEIAVAFGHLEHLFMYLYSVLTKNEFMTFKKKVY